jgi:hypothetical protein
MGEPEYQKLAEAEHFFRLIQNDWASPAFGHNLSAFLAALFSSTEHNRLFAKDPRFSAWYQEAKAKYLELPDLLRLKEFRNKEIHHKGVPAWQEILVPFPEHFPMTGEPFSWTINLSAPDRVQDAPKGSDGVPISERIQKRYIWDTPESPDVLELCEKGPQLVRQMMYSHQSMHFKR